MADPQQIEVTAFWQELGPNDIYMRNYIGELDISDERKWEICGSLNGLDLFVQTDIPNEADISKHRRFKISGSGLLNALASTLLRPEQEAEANDALAPEGEA